MSWNNLLSLVKLIMLLKINNFRVLNETALEVLNTFSAGSSTSLRIVALQVAMSHETVSKAQMLNKLHLTKFQILQHLFDDDFDRRIEFCKAMSDLIYETRMSYTIFALLLPLER